MSYLRDFSKELKEMLPEVEEGKLNTVIRRINDKVLESYRNGIEAGERSKGKGKKFSRRRGFTNS